MTKNSIKETIAPCGLCCETCFAHIIAVLKNLFLKKIKSSRLLIHNVFSIFIWDVHVYIQIQRMQL